MRARGDEREEHLGRGHVRVLAQEVVLGGPDVLEPELLAHHRQLKVLEQALLLIAGDDRLLVRGHEHLREIAELHGFPLVIGSAPAES